MLIYISHPYGGQEANKQKIEQIIRRLVKEHTEHTYVSPVHAFGFLYNDVDYEYGLDMCLKLLYVCDKMLVFGDYQNSRGCKAEIEYCMIHNIDYEIRSDLARLPKAENS